MVKLTVERIALGKAVLNLLPRQLISCSKTAFRSSLLLEVVRVTIGELASLLKSVGSFNNDECDGNESAKKAMGLLSKTTTARASHPFCTFLYRHCAATTWKCLISRFMEDVNNDDEFFFLFLNLSAFPKKSTLGKFAYVWHFQPIGINATMFEKTRMPFLDDVFAAVAAVNAKAP